MVPTATWDRVLVGVGVATRYFKEDGELNRIFEILTLTDILLAVEEFDHPHYGSRKIVKLTLPQDHDFPS